MHIEKNKEEKSQCEQWPAMLATANTGGARKLPGPTQQELNQELHKRSCGNMQLLFWHSD